VLHEDAALEYEAAFDWYMERSILAASKFAAAVNRAMDMIVEAPQRWPTSCNGTRRFLLQKFPFAIVYRELPTVIQMVAIAHTRRKPGYWKQRI